MAFKNSYSVIARYLTSPSKRRSGRRIERGDIRFIVAHDTGNPGTTAAQNVAWYESSRDEMSASAHVFVDDGEIIECIPALTGPPEKAWHVIYNVATDDRLFGVQANDAAIGIEYCFGEGIDPDQSYVRYVWTLAYACCLFGLDPTSSIVSHRLLDPERRTDPDSGLACSHRTYSGLLADVLAEYRSCLGLQEQIAEVAHTGVAVTTLRLNIRQGKPSSRVPVVRVLPVGERIDYVAFTSDGEQVNGNSVWYKTITNDWFWSGGVRAG